jgi:hypothetical protein
MVPSSIFTKIFDVDRTKYLALFVLGIISYLLLLPPLPTGSFNAVAANRSESIADYFLTASGQQGESGASVLPDSGTGIASVSCGASDGDKDGVCNTWETTNPALGIPYTNSMGGTSYYSLCSNGVGCPNSNEADIYVEIDSMVGHIPSTTALTRVENIFQGHTFKGKTVDLHVDVDETSLQHVDSLNTWVDPVSSPMDTSITNDFFFIKKHHFGTPVERTASATAPSNVVTDSSLSPSDTIVKFENQNILVSTTAATEGKVVVTTQVKFTASGNPINPGTLTASVSMTGSHASLQVGTPTSTVSAPTTSTRMLRVSVPISPDSSVTSLALGTIKVTLTASSAPSQAITMSLDPVQSPLPYVTTTLLDAKAQVYHYVLFVHSIGSCGPSGVAEVNGNDFIVALGCNFAETDPTHSGTEGSGDEQAGTFMHELGHNMNLDHGGPRYLQDASYTPVPSTDYSMNCKPNYHGVMSYAWQFPYEFTDNGVGWTLDFSNETMSTLNEASIVEANGLYSVWTNPIAIVYGTPNLPLPNNAEVGYTYHSMVTPIDWNGDGDTLDSGSMDINNLRIKGCGLDDNGNPNSISNEVMVGFEDWQNLEYNFRRVVASFD